MGCNLNYFAFTSIYSHWLRLYTVGCWSSVTECFAWSMSAGNNWYNGANDLKQSWFYRMQKTKLPRMSVMIVTRTNVFINPRRACAARVTVLGLCVCYSTSHFSRDYSCHKRYQPSQRRMRVENFKRFSLKMLRCEARAFPVGTATFFASSIIGYWQ